MRRILSALLALVSASACATVKDIKIPQQSIASPPTWPDVIISPAASSMLGFGSDKAVRNVTIGTGLTMSGAGVLSASGAGSGTVTSFSAGTLSPLFTTSVSTATSTPALSFTLSTYATIASLKALSVSGLATGTHVTVLGYFASGDGGGGLFYYNSASSSTDNGGTVIAPNAGSGRWIRVLGPSGIDVRMFGAVGDGSANDTDEIAAAIVAAAASTTTRRVYIPAPYTFLCGTRTDAGTTLLPMGNVSNVEIYGNGNGSILKLANGMSRGTVLFGSGVGQSVTGVSFHDIKVDLNGPNNLQTAFDNPTRFNSFIYFFSPTLTDISIERVYVRNGSGSQIIRITDDSTSLPARITIRECTFYGFGLGIPGNFSYDTSAIYIFGDAVTITGNHFLNDSFTFDTSHGLTGVEYHSGTGANISGNDFTYVQGPIILIATHGAVNNTTVYGNSMTDCMNSFLISGTAGNDFNRVTIQGNHWISSVANQVGTFFIGDSVDPDHRVRDLDILDNVFTNTSTAVGKACIILEDTYYDSIRIIGNTFRSFTAPAIYIAGVQHRSTATLEIKGNIFDSNGPNASGSPYFPSTADAVQIVASPSSTAPLNALVIENNLLTNDAARSYTSFGGIYLGANLRANTIFVRNNTKSGDATAAVVTDAGASATQFFDVRTLTPQPTATLGTSVTVLHGNATGPPSYGVVTPSDAAGNVSGTGNFALVGSPTFTGTVNVAALTASGTVGAVSVTASTGFTNTNASNPRYYFNTAQTVWLDYVSGQFQLRDADGDVTLFPTSAGTVLTTATPVTAAQGGTGLTSLGTNVATWLGTPSSANLAAAVTGETGSGALVFASTPTFVPPMFFNVGGSAWIDYTGAVFSFRNENGFTNTMPNSTGTVLTTAAAVTVAQGGTGATTLTGILKGNGTSAFTAVTAPSGTIVGTTDTQTLTNKKITQRVITTTDDATAVIDVTLTDVYELSAVATATTFSTTGTPVDGQAIIIRFKDAGVAKGLTWDAIFVVIGVTLPTTTVAGKWHYIGVKYNATSSKFDVLAVAVQA